jgi:hypothetical protein
MSKKYVPSFLKDQSTLTNSATSNQTSFWPGQKQSAPLSASNQFAALSDDPPMKKDKPVINTSLPAKEAPKLAPATLASLTSNGKGAISVVSSGTGPKMSFASKFAEKAKIASDPNYVPPPKPVDFTSEDDFPSLAAPAKPVTGAWSLKPKNEIVQPDTDKSTLSFADKAKEWAKQKEEEAEEARRKEIEEEKMRREAALHMRMNVIGINRYRRKYHDDEEDEENNYEQSSLGEDDDYEVPEYDEEPSEEEDEDEDGEFNQNVGWDGRRKDDLY